MWASLFAVAAPASRRVKRPPTVNGNSGSLGERISAGHDDPELPAAQDRAGSTARPQVCPAAQGRRQRANAATRSSPSRDEGADGARIAEAPPPRGLRRRSTRVLASMWTTTHAPSTGRPPTLRPAPAAARSAFAPR